MLPVTENGSPCEKQHRSDNGQRIASVHDQDMKAVERILSFGVLERRFIPRDWWSKLLTNGLKPHLPHSFFLTAPPFLVHLLSLKEKPQLRCFTRINTILQEKFELLDFYHKIQGSSYGLLVVYHDHNPVVASI